ncbi:hypothetical protein OEZ86_007380 [Tetradesmus obliquus]|nr:hypothetical protein OEZ86_007380 [Tetradesmus obliquus]
MQQAAPGLPADAGSSSSGAGVQPQHQQQDGSGADEQQQQQQQQQGGSSSSSSGPGWSWREVQCLVVYGLGSPDDSKVSRHQGLLPGLSQPPLLFDPAFSEADRLLLQGLGLRVIEENEEGRRAVQGPTLFYLPHCEAGLTDNLLLANASPQQQHLALLGNSFGSYQARWAAPSARRPSTVRPDRLLQLVEQGAVCELRVPDHGYSVASAFNDMSLHTFSAC